MTQQVHVNHSSAGTRGGWAEWPAWQRWRLHMGPAATVSTHPVSPSYFCCQMSNLTLSLWHSTIPQEDQLTHSSRRPLGTIDLTEKMHILSTVCLSCPQGLSRYEHLQSIYFIPSIKDPVNITADQGALYRKKSVAIGTEILPAHSPITYCIMQKLPAWQRGRLPLRCCFWRIPCEDGLSPSRKQIQLKAITIIHWCVPMGWGGMYYLSVL